MTLHIPAHKPTRLVPMTLRVHNTLHDEIHQIWEQISLIARDQPVFGGFPVPHDPRGIIANEAAARRHLDQHLVSPIHHVVNGLATCARNLASGSQPIDERIDRALLEALARVDTTIIRAEDARGPLSTPSLDAQQLVPQPLDHHRLVLDLRHNEPIRTLQAEVIAETRHARDNRTPNLYDMSDEQAIAAAKALIRKPRADYSINWLGSPDVTELAGGVPFYVLEVKDPNRLPFDLMKQILTSFSTLIDNDEDIELFDNEGLIRFRFAYCLCDDLLDPLAEGGMQAIAHLYSELFYKRQTYGALSTSAWYLTMAIDWHHAEEPGEHVSVTLINLDTTTIPDWRPPGPPLHDFFSYGLCTAVLQLSTGLVPAPTFEAALSALASKHAKYAQSLLHDDQSVDPESPDPGNWDDDRDDDYAHSNHATDSDSDEDRVTRRARATQGGRSNGTRRARHDGATNAPSASAPQDLADDPNERLLRILANSPCREEIQRFLALDETTVAIPYRKEELLRILCAVIPYRPAGRKGGIRTAAAWRALKHRRPDADVATDRLLFTFGSIGNGWLPEGYCRRLAWMDYPDSARALAARAPRFPSGGSEPTSLVDRKTAAS